MSEPRPSARYRLRTESVAWTNMEPNAVLVHLDRDEVHLANPVAATIIEVLQKGEASLDELTAHVTEAYEVDRAQAERDIVAFVNAAVEAGVVEQV